MLSFAWYLLFFFFFKQKTAYEIGVRLVGSEMCIRDSIIALSFTGDKTLVLQKLYTKRISFVKNVTLYMALFFLWGNDEGISSINCREIKI